MLGGVFNSKVFNEKIFNCLYLHPAGEPFRGERKREIPYKYAVSSVNMKSPIKVKALSTAELKTAQLIKQRIELMLINPIRRSVVKNGTFSSSILKEHKLKSDVKSAIIKPAISVSELLLLIVKDAKLKSLFKSYVTKNHSLNVNLIAPLKLKHKIGCIFEAYDTKQLYELLKQILTVDE